MPLPPKIQATYDSLSKHEVILEQALSKYKPGMMGDPFVDRWCRLNKDSFKVYSGSEAFAPLQGQPLVEILISNVAYVQRVKYDVKHGRTVRSKPGAFEH